MESFYLALDKRKGSSIRDDKFPVRSDSKVKPGTEQREPIPNFENRRLDRLILGLGTGLVRSDSSPVQ